MKITTIIIVIALATTALCAEKVQYQGLTFDTPSEFTLMSEEMKKIKYPRGNPPQKVFTNKSTETTIAIGTKDNYIPQDQIETTRKAWLTLYEKLIGGFELKESKVINVSSQKWLMLDFISNTIDSKVRNIILATGYKNKLMVLNFSSTPEEFTIYENVIRKSIATIKLK